ncbi:MAG: FAD-dependent oxidoreductase [Acidobacteria bacterium]|nr:FAD-dependent oxidoreductase [Acidobacteriota bacterium]
MSTPAPTSPSPVPPRLPWEAPAREPDDRETLHRIADEILDRCRGEGPANCVGQCPLHVDARAYVQLAKQGRYQEALQKVREMLPFPGILGYVCAHPCELRCKRIDDDSAIRIRDIKRFLADRETGVPQHIVDREPDRGKNVAVVGAGPAGLIAAYDLARRGYRVTILEKTDRIGGCLVHKIPEFRLPRRVVDRDLSVIAALGIEVKLGVPVGSEVTIASLRETYDAVLVLVGYEGSQALLRSKAAGVARSARQTLAIDPLTCETETPGVFAAGDAASGPSTVIQSLAAGRRAAESAHRFLSKLDLRLGREPVLPQRPLWTLEIDEPERQRRERTPVMLKPHNEAMTEAEVRADADRCLDCTCGLCVQDCEFLAKYCKSPKELARQLKAGIEPEATRAMAYSCNICSLCARVCPEDLDTGKMMITARRLAVKKQLGPMPQHKPIISYWKAGVAGLFSMVMAEPGRQKSKRLFFTGCALPAVAPGHAITVYDALRRDNPGTGVLMICCGAPVELLGMDRECESTVEMIYRMAESVGAEELVPACPDCTHTLREVAPQLKIRPIWEYLAETWQPPKLREGTTVSIHDSCKAQHEPEMQAAIRTLVERSGAKVEEVEYRGEKSRCCGFGGMIYPVDAQLSQTISKRRTGESPHPMLTYCAGCRMALRGVGKESLHLLDFIYAKDWKAESMRPAPGSLTRYARRIKTKWNFKRLKPLGAR